MKKVFFALPLLLVAQYVYAQSNVTTNNKFFSIILEIDQDDEGLRTASLIASQIHEGRLKRPTKSQQAKEGNVLVINFLDEAKNSIHQLKLENELLTDYEYVNEDDQLTHIMLPEKKKSYHIRIPYNPNIVTMDIFLNDVLDDKKISSFSLQNN